VTTTPTIQASHRDPGERIVADTLSDLWPRTLEHILTHGHDLLSQHGLTRELAGLVTVIRDPGTTIDEIWHAEADWLLDNGDLIAGLQAQDVIGHTERLTTAIKTENTNCSYGSRMAGEDDDGNCYADARDEYNTYPPPPDQLEGADSQLTDAPLSRAIYLTPWSPALDNGQENGPDLVGVQFRARPVSKPCGVCNACDIERIGCACDGAFDFGCFLCSPEQHKRPVCPHVLDLFVTFRSLDFYIDAALELAAVCLWLTRTAEKHGMAVGRVMGVFNTAHILERDWEASSYEVTEAFDLSTIQSGASLVWRVERVEVQVDGRSHQTTDAVRATALYPTGSDIVAALEAPTPMELMLEIDRSGLVTNIDRALWLGREIERVWRDDP